MPDQTFTAGQVLTAAQMSSLQSNIGLGYINSFSATSGTTVVCSSVFSSTYDAYRVVISDMRLAGGAFCSLKLGAAATNYYYGRLEVPFNNATALGRGGSGAGVATAFDSFMIGDTVSAGAVIDIFNPNLARQTTVNISTVDPRTGGVGVITYGGIQSDTTSFTAFTFTAGNTITNCKIDVYGYRKP
jgi:hypothetical protein